MSAPAARALFVGFHNELNQGGVRAALAEEGAPDFVALVSRSNFLQERADVFVDSSAGYRDLGFEASRDWPFPSRELWERLRPAEVVAMRMMDRVHRISGARNRLESRKRRWLEWASWAHGFLAHHRIDRVVHCNVPHFPFEYVLHEVARAMGIETRFLMQLAVQDTFVMASSIPGLYDDLREALGQGETGGPLPELEPRMESELERRIARKTPFYMHSKGVPLGTAFHRWQRRFFRWKLRAIPTALAYRRARCDHDGGQYVYFPLHLQPEATTLPVGGAYTDQILVVEALARTLPKGWRVLVKENPKQRFDKRAEGFYRRLASLPSVCLVSRGKDSFDLIKGAEAVATITGTAGWEALCLGRPVLTFGNAFYRHAAGSVPIDGQETLRAALAGLEEGTLRLPTRDDCVRFLGALQSVSFSGVSDPVYLRDGGGSDRALAAADIYSRAARAMLGLPAPRSAPEAALA